MTIFLPNSAIFLAAVAGVIAWLFGWRRTGLALATPAMWRWLLWPIAQPLLAEVPVGVWLLLAIVGVPLLPFVAVWVLQGWFVNPAFGKGAGAHVAAVYLTRIIDAYLAMLVALVTWPFRQIQKAKARRR